MGQFIGFTEADQKRFDCDEWLPIALADVSIADLEELSERFNFDPDDWPEPILGEIRIEEAGNPDVKRKPPRWAGRALVWMALRQNGHDTSWEDAGKATSRRRYRYDPDPEEPGKALSDGIPSETSDASTTGLSEISSS